MDQLASYKAMQPATLNQLVPSSAPLTARPISLCGKVRAIGLGSFSVWTAPKQFPTDRRGAASQQQADRSKARPAPMLRQNHATFLAVEVLVSFVHRNILCPLGAGCCT